MAKKTSKPTITLDSFTWTLASVLSRPDLPLTTLPVLLGEDVSPQCMKWRKQREQEARDGSVTALADLIRFSVTYLAWPWTIATVYALRSALSQAKTRDARARVNDALDCLAQAVRGQDLRGRPRAPAGDAANLYGLLLPLYEAAAQGKRLKDIVPYRTLEQAKEAVEKREAPVSVVLLLEAVRRDADSVDLPPSLNGYFETTHPEGITRNEPPPRTGKVWLWSEYTFTVPEEDRERLRKKTRRAGGPARDVTPSSVALVRVKTLLGMGKDGGNRDWVTRLVRKGRRAD